MENQTVKKLNEYRCDCGRLLFKGELLKCLVEIKCKKCGKIKTITYGLDDFCEKYCKNNSK